MSHMIVERMISAPVGKVFETVADIRRFSEAIPHITQVEFLSESRAGVGTQFRETRLMRGKEASTELEVTEYALNDHVRMVTDTHGCVWDTVFTVKAVDGGTLLTMDMEARPHKLFAKIVTPLIRRAVQNAVAEDMDAVKAYCERGAPSS